MPSRLPVLSLPIPLLGLFSDEAQAHGNTSPHFNTLPVPLQ